MGTTLQNGVYLPNEGERNCYAGLKTNWEILDQKVADVTALQQAVAGALHREIVESLPTTDIDPNTIYMVLSGTSATENVYNEFMYVNNAWELIGTSATDLTNYYTKAEVDGKLLLKANDSDVVHKSGNETVGGNKTFSSCISSDGSYLGNESSGNERTNLCLRANRDTDGQSGAYIGRFRQNRAQGEMSGGDVSFITFDFLENSVRYPRCFTMGLTDWDSDGVPQTYYITTPNGKGTLGTSYQQWNKVYANEYYYGSNNVEFSNKFCTLDTDQTVTSIKSFMGLRTEFKRSNNYGVLLFSNGTFSKGDTPSDVTQISRKYYGDTTSISSSIGYSSFSIQNNGNKTVYQLYSVANTAGSSSRTVFTLNYDKSLSGTDAQYATFGGNVLPDVTGTYNLGNSTNKWSTINGLEPSSLGMPDLSNGIDISSYITVNGANKESLYTPTVNGWVSVALTRTGGSAMAVMLKQGNFASSGHNITQENGTTTCNAMLPVKGGVQVSINSALADGIYFAYFYPCLGNV